MKFRPVQTIFLFLVLLLLPAAGFAETIQVLAAGSLKAAFKELAAAYEAGHQDKVSLTFGPSGILRKSIEDGGKADVFASANTAHPEKLASDNWGGPVAVFARNTLCAISQPDMAVMTDNLLDVLLDKQVRVGTSTPKADPSGDYAWELFGKAETIRPGSGKILETKALQLTGGPDSAKAPEGRNQYGWVMGEKKADVFLTYCTNAVLAQKDVPALKIVAIPGNLAVGADYGLIVGKNASPEAWRFAMFVLSIDGQGILGKYGFAVR